MEDNLIIIEPVGKPSAILAKCFKEMRKKEMVNC